MDFTTDTAYVRALHAERQERFSSDRSPRRRPRTRLRTRIAVARRTWWPARAPLPSPAPAGEALSEPGAAKP